MRIKIRQEVYDDYWRFAAERQEIFFRRLEGELPPYTSDPILSHYKFCNTYRASDRVSQFLIKEVIYSQQRSDADTLFRIFLFRLLNKNTTWMELEKRIEEISLTKFNTDHYASALENIRKTQPIYGNAFILCANKAFGFDQKHRNHLALLEQVFVKTNISNDLLGAKSLKDLFKTLRSLPLIGDFMAYQIAIDMNYSEVFNFNENDFTIAGPGAIRGIKKCIEDPNGTTTEEIISYMVEHQDEEFARLGLTFKNLGGRKLHAIDCQGLFCETDKYSRVKHPELKSSRSKIKSTFKPLAKPIDYMYPPKWNIRLG